MSQSPSSQPLDVDAILRGDRMAFGQLVQQESPRLYRMAYRMLRDESEAQSVVQETFLQAFQGLGSFRREAKLTTWLYGIGLNLARGVLRKQRRYQPLDEEGMDRLQPTFMNGMRASEVVAWNPEQYAEAEDRHRLVHEAIGQLPEAYRTVVLLRDIEQLSTTEAAEALGISEGALRVRLHRARHALRTLLDPYFRED
ncbi:MAG: sigma-70 family RNA polymerase sigma factor [Bacteroidota bacterium]